MSLADLLNRATPGPWEWRSGGYFDSGAKIVNLGNAENPTKYPVLDCDALGDPDEADARLIALAPDMARLLIDMADALALTRGFVPKSEQIGVLDLDALLARFADLDTKAGGAQ